MVAAFGHLIAASIILGVIFIWQDAESRPVGITLTMRIELLAVIGASLTLWLLFQAFSELLLILIAIEANTRPQAKSPAVSERPPQHLNS